MCNQAPSHETYTRLIKTKQQKQRVAADTITTDSS
jgi:hypothetical protein